MIRILGGGPAGCAAAIAARQHGAQVEIVERSRLPRHKVCGEFISPEAAGVLQSLGVWEQFLRLRPAAIGRLTLAVGRRTKSTSLPQPAFGLSRYALDALLFDSALCRGATAVSRHEPGEAIDVLAAGRRDPAARGRRLFGFKAHFHGPVNDAVELYFFDRSYVGVSAVEGGATNVCGLAPEDLLRAYGFDYDRLIACSPPLADRLRPLGRSMQWLSVGPLVFRNRFRNWPDDNVYPAGDCLSFVDPFTGSGILSALLTGRLAGIAAVQRMPMQRYLAQCRGALAQPFGAATLFRTALRLGVAESLAPLVPAGWMYRVTRPHGA